MRTYKLIKPIGDYPLEDYIQIDDGNYAICIDGKRVILEKEIVENMPEYFIKKHIPKQKQMIPQNFCDHVRHQLDIFIPDGEYGECISCTKCKMSRNDYENSKWL